MYRGKKAQRQKKENQVKNIMENNVITLRKYKKQEESIKKIKDNKILSSSTQEKNYLISSINISEKFENYWNKEKNKEIILFMCLNNEKDIISKYSVDKINLIKFVLFQLNQAIINNLNNSDHNTNFNFIQNIFDSNVINKLIINLYEFTIDHNNNSNNYNSVEYRNTEIIIYNICKILISLTVISKYFSILIIQHNKNLELILFSLYYFKNKNQFLCCNLLILIYNIYLDDKNTILYKSDKFIPFIFECLYNYINDPIENIIQIDFLYSLLEFIYLLIEEKEFYVYLKEQNINKFISLIIKIYQNYINDTIKICSLKCLSNLFHYVNENKNIKIENLSLFIKSLLTNLNIEIDPQFNVIKILEIISSISYLFEIDEFFSDELLNSINQILISLVLHKEQIQIYYNKIQMNNIFDNISILLLNFCFSSKVCNDIIQNTSIIKNVILILYNYSLEINVMKNLYNFLNEFMDNIDNFIFLIICNFLDIGINKSLDKYMSHKNYEIILIILKLLYKALEFGKVENNSNMNFVQSFFDKKGINDKLNLIISPDFEDLTCSNLAKKIQEDFFQ